MLLNIISTLFNKDKDDGVFFMPDEKLKIELNKFTISQAEHDAELRHKWEQESHWKFQRWFWVGTVILLALGIVFK